MLPHLLVLVLAGQVTPGAHEEKRAGGSQEEYGWLTNLRTRLVY